jgi:predicted nucleic acid-binding protein
MYLALAIELEGQLVTADQKLYSEISKQVLQKYLIWVEEI